MLLLSATAIKSMAQQLSDTYTKQRPVVIVCDWDKAPYEFLNDKGQPSGSNIDVIQAVMKELNLPAFCYYQQSVREQVSQFCVKLRFKFPDMNRQFLALVHRNNKCIKQ